MEIYKEWMNEEKKWRENYRKRTFRKVCLIIVPIVVVFMALFLEE